MAEEEGMAAGTDKKRVLVVEDDKTFRTVLQMVLDENGYEVHCSVDCPTASRYVLRHPFDAFIIDYGMDGKYAPSFVRFLRERFPASVIIAMSGHHDGTDFAGTGTDLFLSKPIEFDRLMKTLEKRDLSD
ncbi:MAG: response regulator [Nitrospirota bacterium]|nr:response regulator [Nitrospirota bacterium]